ncbi:MAG: 30S ribosomal protein S2 [Chloroflexota bacterium]|nr:MAG: 30S ribosomal protein S2 [Chloroflexota bacterium]
MASILPMKSLLEAGVHFGHRTRRWNPRMKQFIFTQRNGIHIIDLQQTMQRLEEAYKITRDTVAEGGAILFVGTKKQAQETVQQEAMRCGMPYVNNRWLGGTLTNFRTIRARIDYMIRLEERQAMGELDKLPKKEALLLTRELSKLETRLGGLREMKRLPRLLFIIDTLHEQIAINEATTLDIPLIALTDTNSDPFPIQYPIPANDDAIRAIKLITAKIADGVIEGKNIRGVVAAEQLEEGAPAELHGELEQALSFEPGESDLLETAAPAEVEIVAAETETETAGE